MERPPGIYASSLSRRDLARRKARMRSSFAARAGNWLGVGTFVVLAGLLVERLVQ